MIDLICRAFGAVLCFWVAMWVVDLMTPFDETDTPPSRSGVVVTRDAKTGCEYLKTFFGSITPRLDVKGKPFCWPPHQAVRP